MVTKKSELTAVENVIQPGHSRNVDARKYEAMKSAYLKVLPKASPGLSSAEIKTQLLEHLPEDLFPNGAKAGWWAKAVQLDLEAKGIVAREKATPLRFYKA